MFKPAPSSLNSLVASAAITALVLVVVNGCARQPRAQPVVVSLVELIATPERYAGERVYVCGFFHHQYEERALYLSRDDARHGLYQNAIWIGECRTEALERMLLSFNDSFIVIQGHVDFDGTGKGHLGMLRVALEDIDRVAVAKDRMANDED